MTSLKLSYCTATWETALVAFSADKFSRARFVDQCRRVHEISAIEGTGVVIGLSRTNLSLSLGFVHPFFFRAYRAIRFALLITVKRSAQPVNHERSNSYNKEIPSGRQ